MIQYAKDRKTEYKENMRGGNGAVGFAPLCNESIAHMRLLSVITLDPGCSIGAHVHTQEAEVFYILEGEATVLDNGQLVTLHPGDAHLCRDGEEHCLQNNSASTLRLLAIIPTLAE